jgi:hypothetical protein
MTKPWYKLKIDTSHALVDPWPLVPQNPDQDQLWSCPQELIFTKEWMNYIQNLGLTFISTSMVFYRNPNYSTQYAHVDVDKVNDPDFNNETSLKHYGVNWVLKGKGSSMVWYNTPDEKYQIAYTKANTPYINFKVETLNEIDRCYIQLEPVLVRVDIPHNISVGNEERWCISARFFNHVKEPSWDTVVELFRSKNLLIEH